MSEAPVCADGNVLRMPKVSSEVIRQVIYERPLPCPPLPPLPPPLLQLAAAAEAWLIFLAVQQLPDE